jgi:hypothetical protein
VDEDSLEVDDAHEVDDPSSPDVSLDFRLSAAEPAPDEGEEDSCDMTVDVMSLDTVEDDIVGWSARIGETLLMLMIFGTRTLEVWSLIPGLVSLVWLYKLVIDWTYVPPVRACWNIFMCLTKGLQSSQITVLLDSGAAVSLTPDRKQFGGSLQPTPVSGLVANGSSIRFGGVGQALGQGYVDFHGGFIG